MNYMIEQIHSLPELMKQIYGPLDETIRRKIDHELCLSMKRLYVVGCGDSHHAALSTEFAFETLTKLPDDPMTSMLFGRYAAGLIPQSGPKTNVVIGISVSGAVSRTAEALRMGRQAGATTLALTATPGSPLAAEADVVLDVPVPSFPEPANLAVPGVRSYFTSQVGLYLIAIRIAEVRGMLNNAEAAAYRAKIRDFTGLIDQTIEGCDPVAKKSCTKMGWRRRICIGWQWPQLCIRIICCCKNSGSFWRFSARAGCGRMGAFAIFCQKSGYSHFYY